MMGLGEMKSFPLFEVDGSPFFLAPQWKSIAQLFLDTTAFNGHGTLSQMLWMAVPTLTRPLERIGQRIGASVVLASAAPELVAQVTSDRPKRPTSTHASGTQEDRSPMRVGRNVAP